MPPALQILGLTATPTSKDSLAATLAGMRELARNLAAEYVVVSEKDEELLVRLCDQGGGGGGMGMVLPSSFTQTRRTRSCW